MAKKRNINILEAHLEKLILGVAVVVFIWFVLLPILKPSGESGSELAQEGAQEAQALMRQMEQPVEPEELEVVWEPVDPQVVRQPLLEQPFDEMAPFPMYNLTVKRQESDRQYTIPEITGLGNIQLQITRGLAVIGEQEPQRGGMQNPGMAGMGVPGMEGMGMDPMAGRAESVEEVETRDVDFVTVEGQFNLRELREKFEENFVTNAEKPLENAEPVVALVQLERGELLANGNWSDYEVVEGMEEGGQDLFTLEQIQQMSPTEFEVLMTTQESIGLQMDILQPSTYSLVGREWQPLSAQQTPERGRRTRQQRDQRNVAPAGMAPGAMGGGMGEMAGGMMRGGRGGEDQQLRQYWMTTDTIPFWAHDTTVEPGKIYRYRIRVGFFNPIAGRDWFAEGQEGWKNQRILWTPWGEPDYVAKVQEQTLFFPRRLAGPLQEARVIRVDVYRWQQGFWHQRTFPVSPGVEIGSAVTERIWVPMPARDRVQLVEQNAEIDYRTGVTVLDILPESTYWRQEGTSPFEQIETPELVYKTEEGAFKRLGVNNRSWPLEMQETEREFKRIMRNQQDFLAQMGGRR